MTKILVWNIQQFSDNKFFSTSRKRSEKHGQETDQQAALRRRQVLERVLLATEPHIFVVIEVSTGENWPTTVLGTTTGGFHGCNRLLNYLRYQANPAIRADDWRLVPLLTIGTGGKTESMGVFYRGQLAGGGQRYFTGPNIWTGIESLSPEPARVPQEYPPHMQYFVVPLGENVRTIPAGALHNAGLHENLVAARVDHFLLSGADRNLHGYREPYMVTFSETDAAGHVTRDLTLFGIHSPPQKALAQAFINIVAQLDDVKSALGANETRVICGDFNLNLLDDEGNDAHRYQALTNHGYTVLLNPVGQQPRPPVPAADLERYKGYFATHIKPPELTAASKFLWSNTPADQSYYPSYGYIGSDPGFGVYDSIDNILVRPHRPAPHDYQTTILNPIVGSPFNKVNPPPGNAPEGSIAMNHSFINVAAGWPPAPTAPNYNVGTARNLTGWANYGHIKSTSDHFALYAEI